MEQKKPSKTEARREAVETDVIESETSSALVAPQKKQSTQKATLGVDDNDFAAPTAVTQTRISGALRAKPQAPSIAGFFPIQAPGYNAESKLTSLRLRPSSRRDAKLRLAASLKVPSKLTHGGNKTELCNFIKYRTCHVRRYQASVSVLQEGPRHNGVYNPPKFAPMSKADKTSKQERNAARKEEHFLRQATEDTYMKNVLDELEDKPEEIRDFVVAESKEQERFIAWYERSA